MLLYCCSIVCLSALAVVPLSAADWHVYPNGSGDAETIAEAAELAASGDAIYIHAGTYIEAGILFESKDVFIVTLDGRVYIEAPAQGSGTGITIRGATAAFQMPNLYFADFDTALALEDASPWVQFITIGDCGTGITIDGASAPFVINSVIDTCVTAIDVSGAVGASIRNLTVVGCSTGMSVSGGEITIARCIIYGCGTGLACGGGTVTLNCNDLFSNMVQYDGCSAGSTDFDLDPIFCFYTPPATNPYWLHEDSPCLPAAEPCGPGTYVGFYATAGCTGTSVEESSWGTIKSLYR